MRDGGDVEDRIRLGQRVIAGVVAKRPFLAQRLLRVHVAFDDKVRVGRHFQVVGLALDQFDGLLAQIAGEQELIQAVGQRRGGAEGEHRVAAEEHRHGHARAGFVVTPPMPRADLLQLPVHAGGALVIDLHAIHADVALAGIRVLRDHARQRDEAPAVQRPALLDGQIQQSWAGGSRVPTWPRTRWDSRPTLRMSGALRPGLGARGRRVELVNDLLARAVLHQLRFGVAQVQGRAEQSDGLLESWSAAWPSSATRVRPRPRQPNPRPGSSPCASASPAC